MLYTWDLDCFSDIALAANSAEIRSTAQLSVFLKCANRSGISLYDIFGIAPDEPEYKGYYTAVRQLMLGASNRGYNGANLLIWGESLYGKERSILLTLKGKNLLKHIKSKLSNK